MIEFVIFYFKVRKIKTKIKSNAEKLAEIQEKLIKGYKTLFN